MTTPTPDPMRERLARAMRDADPDFLRAADAILAALGPDVVLVTVNEVARRLHEHYEMEAVGVVPGGRWEGQTYIDETRACTPQDHMAQARRLLGGRE